MIIKGMDFSVGESKSYYYTDEMLSEGIYITVYQLKSAEGTPVGERMIGEGLYIIDVNSIDLDEKKTIIRAEWHSVFSRMELKPLEKHGLIKSISDLYSSCSSKEEFIDYIFEMSCEDEVFIYDPKEYDYDTDTEIEEAEKILAEYEFLQNKK